MRRRPVVALAVLTIAVLPTGTIAHADPNSFADLGCRCSQPNNTGPGTTTVHDQIESGIQSGLNYLRDRPR